MERLIPICDFCSSPDVVWQYDAISAGVWAACEVCSALIKAGDREGLIKHSFATFTESLPFPLPVESARDITGILKSTHDLFFLVKYGERRAV